MAGDEAAVFLAVVGARFLIPLLIPGYPLPAIVTALVLDGVDQTIFQALGYDPPGYQGYDKAMDVYYLAIAYLRLAATAKAKAVSGGVSRPATTAVIAVASRHCAPARGR